MKILIVLSTIFAVTLGAAIDDSTTLGDDITELFSLVPREQIVRLANIYKNDNEFKTIATSEDYLKVNIVLFMDQPEIEEFSQWLSKYVKMNVTVDDPVGIDPAEVAKYKPGWKGYMEAFSALYPTDKIIAFIKEKLSESADFTEFWKKVKTLIPVFERVMKLPEYVEAHERLEAMGYEDVETRIYRTIFDSV